ncbi:M12 family metallo-peptidase [Gammaproteobacteria bacterium]|nr:M12 family metallo-peptidase [Gammaproteobacteria bacterium]
MFKNISGATRILILILPFIVIVPAYSNEKVERIWDDNQDFAYWSSESNAALILSKNTIGSTTPSGLVVSLDTSILQTALRSKIGLAKKQNIIYFPNAFGEMIAFDVKEKSNFSPILAAKFPEISAFIGVAVNDASQKIHFSLAPEGIQAAITSSTRPEKVTIEKIRGTNTYAVADLTEAVKSRDGFICTTPTNSVTINPASNRLTNSSFSRIYENQSKFSNASTLTKYRLAVSTNGQYTRYHGGTVAGALAGINATLTHVNAIFERDFGITLELVDNNDLIIYTDPATDPYTDSEGALSSELQINLDAVIGSANYDHGHIFSAISCGFGGCGYAGAIGGFCDNKSKGSAWSDSLQPEGSNFTKLVAHEIGHQVGANHTFSDRSEGTGKNVEPGSGTTVMSYAGITGSNNVALQGDEYFHYVSIEQTLAYLQNQSCHVDMPNENSLPVVEDIPDRTVPILTPYILSGSATDEDSDDVLSYTWEQIDDGVVTDTSFGPKNLSGANFRSLSPSSAGERYMPKLSSVLSGNLTLENPNTLSTWETLSSVPRDLNFGFTVRDNAVGGGGIAQKTMKVSVVDQGGSFSVTSPADGLMYLANEAHTVAWNIAGTNLAPMLADKVTITLSVDGGLTFPYTLASDVDNDGSHDVTMPDFATSEARIRIQPNNNNIFYAISNENFSLTRKDIILSAQQYDYTVCSAESTVASLTYRTSPEYADTVLLSASNLPTALSVGFSPASVSADGTVISATITAGADILAGTYPINIDATSDNRSQSQVLNIKAYQAEFSPIKLLSPSKDSVTEKLKATLTWKADINADQYRIEVSTEESFSELIYNAVIAEASFEINGLEGDTKYYWRVSPLNRCTSGTYGDVGNFTTPDFVSAKELPLIIPAETFIGVYTSTLSVPENGRISDINVLLDMTINNVNFLKITLTSPSNTVVTLIEQPGCGQSSGISAIFDDQGDYFSCGAGNSVPIITGRQKPQKDALSQFNEQPSKGDWVLTVSNFFTNVGAGSLNNFALQITTDSGVAVQNYPPVAFEQSLTALSGQEILIGLRGADPERSPLSYELASNPSGTLEAFSGEKLGDWAKRDLTPDACSFAWDLILFDDEDHAFSAGCYLWLLDVSNPSDPTFVSEVSNFEGRDEQYLGGVLSKDENTLFITQGNEGLIIFDVSDLTNIQPLGKYDTPSQAKSVVLSLDEKTAFVSDRSSQLQIIDVSDLGNPSLLSTFSSYGAISDAALSADGNTLYLVDWYFLESVDVSDPSAPVELGAVSTQIDLLGNNFGGYSGSLVLSSDEKIAYIASTAFGLVIIDISDPTDPKPMGNLFIDLYSTAGSPNMLTLSPDGSTIYLGEETAGVKVIDVRDAKNPILIDTIPTLGNSSGLTLSAAGDTLYNSNYHYSYASGMSVPGGLEIFSVERKSVTAGEITTPQLYYTSPSNGPGTDNFVFKVNDGALDSNQATISVSISDSINNDGTWTYTENSDETLTITGCVGPCPSDLVIPEQINSSPITGVSNHAFADSGITSVTLPGTISKIGDYAFYKNSLGGLTLGANINDIGAGSFSYNSIIVVSFLGDRPNIGADAFSLNRELKIVSYCPGKLDWPGTDISNGVSMIIPNEDCNATVAYDTSLIKIEAAALTSDTANLTLADLEAVSVLNEITPSYIDQYLTFIRLSSFIENVADIHRIISSVNSVMTNCPNSGRFVSVAGENPWPHEISWSLMGNDPDIPLLSGGAELLLFTCIGDGRYPLNMYDSFGDGWINDNGEVDTFFSILSADGTELAKEGLTAGFSGVAIIKLGSYPNQSPIAATQNVDVIRGIPKRITLSGEDADLDKLTMRLTKSPTSGSLYKNISVEPESSYASDVRIYDLALSRDQKTAYVANGNDGLKLISISDSGALDVVSVLDTDGLARSATLSQDEQTIFLADGTLGFKIINVSDKLNPTLVSSAVIGESVYDIALSANGNYAYIAHLSGVSRVDISDPVNPIAVATLLTPGDAQSIALSSDYKWAYVGDGFKGFTVLDISEPTALTLLNSMDTHGEVYSLALSEDNSTLYVADGYFGLKVFNVDNSSSPALIASVTNIGFVRSVEISNNGLTAYLATSQRVGPRMVNISDPSAPVLLSSSGNQEINYVIPSVDETKAYATVSSGLQSFTVSYKNPFTVGDTLLETSIYLSNDSNAQADSFEFLANDGTIDSGNAQVTITILNDTDGDRVADDEDAFPNDLTESIDTDGDGIGNNSDPDDDNDGVPDITDAYPLIGLNGLIDTDSDGIPDNCPSECLLLGMVADDDDDDDGVSDENDAFPLDAAESIDTDSDGIGNNADTDDDGDNVADGADTFPLDATESQDTDSDGVGDNADAFPNDATETVDSDSDGTGDNSDAFPNNSVYSLDSDSDGMPDAWETTYGLNPNDASDATSDQDNDGVSALDEFLAGTIPSGSLDIDGNGQYDALTDGLLLLRGMFGLDGSALVTGTIASDAAYTESVDIESRIAILGDLADIDGNGTIDALTDGLLTLRYLFGLEGETLIAGVVASDATRVTALEIEAHLKTLMPVL